MLLLATALASEAPSHSIMTGAKGLVLASYEEGHRHDTHHGGGGFIEVKPLPHVEFELAVHWMTAEHGALMPIDLLVKGVTHATHRLEPYAGIGPSFVLGLGEVHNHYGFASVIGANVWLTQHVGVFAEPGYNVIWPGPLHEAGGVAGVILGW